MLKVLVVFGTRPEAIKMCPLVKELRSRKGIICRVCLTAQHREMLDQVTQLFGLKADYDLNIMKQGQSLTDITVRIIQEMDKILGAELPDIVLVHGDTTTSFSAALCAFYHGIPVGHVEAGLRTYDLKAPYPEEFNRQTVDIISNILFAPTSKARENLINEGKSDNRIIVTGNTVIDALKTTIDDKYTDEVLEWVGNNKLILVTAHRRENQGIPMCGMFNAIKRIAEEYHNVKILFPTHKNPLVRELADNILGSQDNVKLIEPVNPIQFHNYMYRCYMILTDSGGVQEEAPSLGKPVLVMRDVTERPEGIEAGTLKLVGSNEEKIYSAAKKLLDDKDEYLKMSNSVNPYGDGHASEKIADSLVKFFA